jgi:hypothetical protein
VTSTQRLCLSGAKIRTAARPADRGTWFVLYLFAYTRRAYSSPSMRAHDSFRRLVSYCASLNQDELWRHVEGLGFPTVAKPLEHTIGAGLYGHRS